MCVPSRRSVKWNSYMFFLLSSTINYNLPESQFGVPVCLCSLYQKKTHLKCQIFLLILSCISPQYTCVRQVSSKTGNFCCLCKIREKTCEKPYFFTEFYFFTYVTISRFFKIKRAYVSMCQTITPII
jgi:hypothetical protein